MVEEVLISSGKNQGRTVIFLIDESVGRNRPGQYADVQIDLLLQWIELLEKR